MTALTKEERDAIVIPSPQEFYDEVIKLNSKLEVNQKVNELIELIEQKYAVTTASRKLTEYRKIFNDYKPENDELMESVTTKKGTITQHIAINLLVLTDESNQELSNNREKKQLKDSGFNENGDIREVELPPIDVRDIIDQSLKLLHSNKSEDIVIGLLNLVGKRGFEIAVPSTIDDGKIIDRDIHILGEFLIAFKGIAKKDSSESFDTYWKLPTLAPAKIIVEAYQKLNQFSEIKALEKADNRKFTNTALRKRINKRFEELFGDKLSSISAYDDNGKLVDKDATTHKSRAFYACTVKAVLANRNVKNTAIERIIQNCLHHKTVEQTRHYLGKYDSHNFINLPSNIDIPTNINEVGKMTDVEVKNKIEKSIKDTMNNQIIEKEPVKAIKPKTRRSTTNTISLDELISSCNGNVQRKISEMITEGQDIKKVLIQLLNSTSEEKLERTPVANIIDKVIDSVMEYNQQQKINTSMVYPTYGLINKIGVSLNGKQIALKTYKEAFEKRENQIDEELIKLGIPDKKDLLGWNNKYHRKDVDNIIKIVINIYRNQ